MKTLVLCLGNELLGDDGVGILAARKLREELQGSAAIEETSLSGMALLDFFIGYQEAIVVDAIQTGRHPPGTVIELGSDDLGDVIAPSPHYAGLPEILRVAQELNLEFPSKIRVFAIEVTDPFTVGGTLSDQVRAAIGNLVSGVKAQIERWQREIVHSCGCR